VGGEIGTHLPVPRWRSAEAGGETPGVGRAAARPAGP